MWRIRSLTEKDARGQPRYWSEDVGWTWRDFADLYTPEQKDSMLVPKSSVWEAVPE